MERLERRKFHSLCRAGEALTLNFGKTLWTEVRDGITRQLPEFSLHAQAPWRFLDGETVLLASDGDDADLTKKLENSTVLSVETEENADLTIEFSCGVTFRLRVGDLPKAEFWRMIDFRTGENKAMFDMEPEFGWF